MHVVFKHLTTNYIDVSPVLKVHFPKGNTAQDSISVCFERGGKISSSQNTTMLQNDDNSFSLLVEDTLSLVVTMYKDKDNIFQVLITNKFDTIKCIT